MYSKQYLEELKGLHYDPKRPNGFGGKVKDLGHAYNYINYWIPSNCLDYGCGKGVILSHLNEKFPNTEFIGYDPALPMWDNKPTNKFDMVFSNDVLEHIEPNFINSVLQDIDQYATKYIWLRIDTHPARKELSDGRNAHLIIQNESWWLNILQRNIKGTIVYNEVNKKGKLDIAIEK
jgi:hypothetical protein